MTKRIPPRLHESGCYQIGTSLSSFGRDVILVNPSDRDWTKHRYVLWFGAYGWTRLMVWANSLEDALDEAVDWLADHAPGELADESVHEEYNRLIAEGKSEDEAREEAEMDMTCAGNCGNYIPSWEWGLALEDPTRKELDEFLFPPGLTWTDSMRRGE
jgi:hypothetical protein